MPRRRARAKADDAPGHADADPLITQRHDFISPTTRRNRLQRRGPVFCAYWLGVRLARRPTSVDMLGPPVWHVNCERAVAKHLDRWCSRYYTGRCARFLDGRGLNLMLSVAFGYVQNSGKIGTDTLQAQVQAKRYDVRPSSSLVGTSTTEKFLLFEVITRAPGRLRASWSLSRCRAMSCSLLEVSACRESSPRRRHSRVCSGYGNTYVPTLGTKELRPCTSQLNNRPC